MIADEIDLSNIEAPLTFDLFADAAASAAARDEKTKTRAIRTRSRHHARRAKAEAVLAECLPPVIEQGDAWHVISSGDVDSLSFLAHLLKTTSMDHVTLSTWCMASPDVEQLAAWLKEGRIGRIDAYVGEIFPSQYATAHEQLCAVVRNGGGRVCVFRNHSKLFLCRAGDNYWVIESSANINTNPRTENTCITGNKDLYEHHIAYFSGVKSFNRDFDDWIPAK